MRHTPATPQEHAAYDPAISPDVLLDQHFNAPSEQLLPSSGFTLTVMDTIHRHASMPSSIPFPWKRALSGLATALFALLAFLLYITTRQTASTHLSGPVFTFSPVHPAFSITSTHITIASILFAVALSAATVTASFRLAGRLR